MPFFLPGRLVDFEYLGDEETDEEYERIAKPYQRDIDFAFFAVNFGYSKTDYEELTPREIHFIYKAWENKLISDNYNMYRAVFTAVYNVERPKRKSALKLWKKHSVRRADMESVEENIKIIKEAEENDRNWVARIYEANHLPAPKERDED